MLACCWTNVCTASLVVRDYGITAALALRQLPHANSAPVDKFAVIVDVDLLIQRHRAQWHLLVVFDALSLPLGRTETVAKVTT